MEKAKIMAASILEEQVENNSTDVNENAAQFIVDWVMSNKAYFGTQVIGTCLGMMNESGNTVYIFLHAESGPHESRVQPRKTMKYLADKGLISMYREKNGKITYSTMRRFGDRSCRFVEFFIGKLAENKDPMDDLEDQMDQEEPPMAPAAAPFQTSATQTTMQDGFTVIDDTDDLPF